MDEMKNKINMDGSMTGAQLISLILLSSTFAEMVDGFDQSKQGNIYEKTWGLIIKFGLHAMFPNKDFNHYTGCVNNGEQKLIKNIQSYIDELSVFGNEGGGASDITMRYKNSKKWVFISSKFFLDDASSIHSIKSFDVQDIRAVAGHMTYNCDIYLFVKDKIKVKNIVDASHGSSNYITQYIRGIFGVNDLENLFNNLKKVLANPDGYKTIFDTKKGHLNLRFHQEMLTDKMMTQIRMGEKNLLLGAKARSGKTYCVGGIVSKLAKEEKNKKINILIITPAPTETISQFTDDLFRNFHDFDDMKIIVLNGKKVNGLKLDTAKSNIIIVSKQLLDGYCGNEKINEIRDLDMIIFDESHFHGTTERAENIFKTYSTEERTVRLFLSATYSKPLNKWNIPEECQFHWSVEDEMLCKTRDIDGLVKFHGNEVNDILNDSNMEELLHVYDKMPDIELITNTMDTIRFKDIENKIKNTTCGFSNRVLFSTNKDGTCFNYREDVDVMLEHISGDGIVRDDVKIFNRIETISANRNSRTTLSNKNFTTQLWFLPYGPKQLIVSVSKCLKDRMLLNDVLKNYEILIVNSDKEFMCKDIKRKIEETETRARDGEKCPETGNIIGRKKGMIILAGSQLTLGVTLPLVDVVILLNDIVSSDKIVQMMYRCMTESSDGEKKCGFVVDMNVSRVLNTIIDFTIHNKSLNSMQKLEYIVNNNLIKIDSDLFGSKENKTKLIQTLTDIWRSNPQNEVKTTMRRIENCDFEVDVEDQEKLNKNFKTSIDSKKNGQNVKFDDDNEDELPTGRKITKQLRNGDEAVTDGEASDEEVEVVREEKKSVSFAKDILTLVVPLICILTLKDGVYSILDMLTNIKESVLSVDTEIIYNVFKEQSLIWWGNENVIDYIIKIIESEKYAEKISIISNIALQFKMSMKNLIDRPKELLELIESCLKPKDIEKKKFGEVFTPMWIVFEMLDRLDKHYIEENGKSIFSVPDLKWFDPASGMGNFPVGVHMRLMVGLEKEIPDAEKRRRHIIEDMLYMSEINAKNVFICREIFNGDKYKMNIREGDTLNMNESELNDKWKVVLKNGFDVIVGNPPFNKGGIRSCTGKLLGDKNETIWPDFIKNSLKKWLKPSGYLVFINPLSWLKKSHSMHNEMLDRHVVWLKLWDDIKSKVMINASIPISLYILKNISNCARKPTQILSEIQGKKIKDYSNEYLDKESTIPLAFHSIFAKLKKFIEKHDCKLEYKTKTVSSTGDKMKLPENYTIEDMWAVDTFTLKDGIMVKRASEKHPDMEKRKLIIANKRGFRGAFIDNGRLSLVGSDKFYILGDDLESIQRFMTFDISVMISDFLKYRQSFLEKEVFNYIPDIRKMGLQNIKEDAFYDLIGLTHEEKNQVKCPSRIIKICQ